MFHNLCNFQVDNTSIFISPMYMLKRISMNRKIKLQHRLPRLIKIIHSSFHAKHLFCYQRKTKIANENSLETYHTAFKTEASWSLRSIKDPSAQELGG